MDTKVCSLCKKEVPTSGFYKDARVKDGLYSSCKTCHHNIYKKNRTNTPRDAEKAREYQRRYRLKPKAKEYMSAYRAKYNQTENGKEKAKAYSQSFRKRNKWYHLMSGRIGMLVKRGDTVPQPCEVCGLNKAEGHHVDYNKPFDLMWLCRKHHVEWHQNNTPIYPHDLNKPV